MNARDQGVVREFAALLRQRVPGTQIWAFGSRARGDACESSDLDLCVVVALLDHETRRLIRETAWEIGFAHGLVITTVKYSRSAFEHGPCAASPLVRTVLREGVPA
jgi:DNA polymerase sigma